MMYCDKPNLPVVGKLYRLHCATSFGKKEEIVERDYYPFLLTENPYDVCDTSRFFTYNSKRDILVCLPPHVSTVGRQYQKFLVSGSGEIFVWDDNPEKWLTTEKQWFDDNSLTYWLEEVETEQEE